MEVRERFLNFPIALLRGFTDDHMKCLNDIFDYAVYKMVYSRERIFDNINEFDDDYDFDINVNYIPTLKKRGSELFNSFYGTKYVWTGIHIETWKNYHKKERNKEDLMVLLASLAFKSIIQKKPWAKISNDFLIARMAGFDSAKDENPIPDAIIQFMKTGSRTRSWLFTELETHFKFKRKPGNQRGIICSLTLSPREIEFEYQKSKFLTKAFVLNVKKSREKKEGEDKFKQWKKDNFGI